MAISHCYSINAINKYLNEMNNKIEKQKFTLLFSIDAALRLPPVYFEQNSNKPSNIGLDLKHILRMLTN